jgi:CxxC-x17-CxxC domain-containing protein
MEQNLIQKAIESGIAPFAVTTFRNRERVFGIKTDDRRRHVYLIGKTGMGKTNLIENMLYSDIISGRGVCYVDPHGDTAEKMLGWIPANRINDVIYFNPADTNFPISFNVLEKVAPEYRHLISSGLIGVFKKLWADSWGPRLEYLLRNCILALLEYPDSTLLGINRMLVDKEYRKKVIDKVQDPVIRAFWVDEYSKYGGQFQVEAIAPIQNKIGQFLSTALIRNIVGQVKSTIDLREVMDSSKILILNLSKGRIGEDASKLLGAMMVTKIQLAAMSRVNIKEDDRKDFYLYVDEFQNFATDSFADILSEARKYRLNLIIAHQYIEQLGEVVKPAVFGNVGTIICFRVGAEDAEFLEKEFQPDIMQIDLVNLPKYHIYLKLMIDGVASDPFSARGLPPIYSESLGNEEKVINVSRERYAKPREVVEDKIKRWSGMIDEPEKQIVQINKDIQKKVSQQVQGAGKQGAVSPGGVRMVRPSNTLASQPGRDKKKKKSTQPENRPMFQAICYSCKKPVEVPFKPDNLRPVFCKECLKKARRGQIAVKPNEEVVEDKQPGVSLQQLKEQTVKFNSNQPAEAKAAPESKVIAPLIEPASPSKVISNPQFEQNIKIEKTPVKVEEMPKKESLPSANLLGESNQPDSG